ncbi:thiamine pyrophosphate-binding protein [Puia sp. P3]|uniref:thiamine pyrophosphate-binding protein n=1 Tax=Puia sp. P3 TaxID=3423952 RepID=UPI003D66CA4E
MPPPIPPDTTATTNISPAISAGIPPNTTASVNITPDATATVIVEKLTEWNVDVVFGLDSDNDNPLVQALMKKDSIRYISVHHERSAAFMAASFTKCTGNLGVCIATNCTSAEQLLKGLADAAREATPIPAITCAVDHETPRTPFAVFEQEITGPIDALTVVDLACRSALHTPGIAHISITLDTPQRQPDEYQPAKRPNRTDAAIWPQYLAAAICHQIKDDAILAVDPGARMIFSTNHWRTRTGQILVIANAPATPGFLCPGRPLAWPNRQCVALVNDDDSATLMDDLSAAVYCQLPVKVILIKDSLYSIDFTKLAASYGIDAYACEQPGELHSVLRHALATKSPALIEVGLEASPTGNG